MTKWKQQKIVYNNKMLFIKTCNAFKNLWPFMMAQHKNRNTKKKIQSFVYF